MLALTACLYPPATLSDEIESPQAETTPPPSTFGELHEADGAAETLAFCTPCHSEQIVVQQGLTREDWEELFDYMREEHGMAADPGTLSDKDSRLPLRSLRTRPPALPKIGALLAAPKGRIPDNLLDPRRRSRGNAML